MYTELEPAINLTSTHTCRHAHTYKPIVQTDRDEGQCCLTEIFGEEMYVLTLHFEEREQQSADLKATTDYLSVLIMIICGE